MGETLRRVTDFFGTCVKHSVFLLIRESGTQLAAPHIDTSACLSSERQLCRKEPPLPLQIWLLVRKAGSFFFYYCHPAHFLQFQALFSLPQTSMPHLKNTPAKSFQLLSASPEQSDFQVFCVLKTCLPCYNPEWGILRTS